MRINLIEKFLTEIDRTNLDEALAEYEKANGGMYGIIGTILMARIPRL